MVEIKVADRESVLLKFGNEGTGTRGFIISEARLSLASEHEEKIRELSAAITRHMSNVAEANDKIQRANEVIGGLREELSDFQAKKGRNAPTITMTIPSVSIPPLTVEQVQDAIKEAIGRRLAPEWQPIETAPRDGTQVLVLPRPEDNSGGRLNPVVWCWVKNILSSHVPEFPQFPHAIFDSGKEIRKATHWMPIPEPPR